VRALQALAQAPNQKVFIVPMELASLAGTLGGISQIAASAFGETAAGEAALGARRSTRSVPDSAVPAQSSGSGPAGAPPTAQSPWSA
jgi:hypothetical protein